MSTRRWTRKRNDVQCAWNDVPCALCTQNQRNVHTRWDWCAMMRLHRRSRSAHQLLLLLEIVPNRHKEWKKNSRALNACESRSRLCRKTECVALGTTTTTTTTSELAQCELWTCFVRHSAQKQIKYDVKRHHHVGRRLLFNARMQFNTFLITLVPSAVQHHIICLIWVRCGC